MLVETRKKIKTGLPEDGLFILVGPEKSGKSKFSASFPNSYVLETEKGGGDRIDGRIHDINSLDEFRQVIKEVIENKDIKTIVIDTLDQLSNWIESDVAKQYGLENISDTKPGVDGYEKWGEYRKRIELLCAYFKASGKLVILNAHCREAKIDANGTLVTPMGINLPGKSGPYLAAQADAIGYMHKKQLGSTTCYFLSFQGGPLGAWGSRIEELNDKTLQIPREDCYSAFAAAFTSSVAQNGVKKDVKKAKEKVEA